MLNFIVKKAFSLLLTLFLASLLVFFFLEIAPGNIAINSLGNTITEEQEASFNAQNGLDQPAITRYIRWLIGSDWTAQSAVGKPLTRLYNEKNRQYSWWVVDTNGTLYQNYTQDGETMIRVERQPDGSEIETEMGPEIWKTDAEGFPTFWGVTREGQAAMWVKGEKLESWVLTKAAWKNSAGAPRKYIPLQMGLLRGDPGVSFFTGRPVMETLVTRIKNTLLLGGIAFLVVMPLALALGMLAGLNEGTWIDRFLSSTSLLATGTPEFVSGILLILIFTLWLDVLPGAVVITNDNSLFEKPSMLVLPILTLTLIELGYVLRITRTSMVEVMRTNYIRTAQLKGLPRWQIVLKHAFKNAMMAPITIIIQHINWLIGGIVVVESVFGYPGLGSYVREAALFKDVFAVEAAAMVFIIISVFTQLFADIIYTYLNPRIRYQ
ncbi:MAG: ABC transporter permease [Anaerolineae bacterium]|nr:ABC transporter permease [Anaerolineae bacterium]